MAIQQPGRGVSARCGQGGRASSIFQIASGRGGMGRAPIFRSRQFNQRFGVSGFTLDASSAPLAGVTVDLYSESRIWLDRTISDGAGAYSFVGVGVGSVFLIADLVGVPEVAGISIHNVTPVVV